MKQITSVASDVYVPAGTTVKVLVEALILVTFKTTCSVASATDFFTTIALPTCTAWITFDGTLIAIGVEPTKEYASPRTASSP